MPATPPIARASTHPPAVLSLAAVLDLPAAAGLQAALLTERGHDLEIDAAQVERIGGLCLQVLLAARRTWAQDQNRFRVVNPSEQCREALSLAQAIAPLGMEE